MLLPRGFQLDPPRKQIFFAIILVFFCYWVFFYRLGAYGLWDPDEGRTGVIAKGVLDSGRWLTLALHREPYYDKPAFYFWLVALGLKLIGLNEWAVRLPSAIAATLTVGMVYLWGCAVWGWRRALWAAVILMTSMEFVALGRFANTDMLFTLFFSTALLYFLWWQRPTELRSACQEKGRSPVWIWPFYFFLGLAFLTKGPVGVFLPLLIVGIVLACRKRWSLIQEMHLTQGAVVVAVVSGWWYLLAALRDPEYMKAFLWNHNVLRFFTSQDHPEPITYLFPILLAGFLPWSLFLPPLAHRLWQRRREEGQEERFFFSVWAATVIVFFSLSHNKLGTYILPAFPPLALLTADLLTPWVEGKEARSWKDHWILRMSLLWLGLLLSISPVSEMILKDNYSQYLPLQPPLLPISLFLLLLVSAWLLGRWRWTPWIVSGLTLWFVLWFYGVKAPELSGVRSSRSLAQFVHARAGEHYRVVAIRSESLSFYLPKDVDFQMVAHSAMIESRLTESIPTIAVMKLKHLKEMHQISPAKVYIWTSVPPARVLVANFPPMPAQDLGRAPKD